jgi:hypothetical protein
MWFPAPYVLDIALGVGSPVETSAKRAEMPPRVRPRTRDLTKASGVGTDSG